MGILSQLRWQINMWRLRRHLPANYEQLSGANKLRAVNNAVVARDHLDPNLIRPVHL